MKRKQRMLHPEIAPMESMDICFGLCLLWSLLALCSLFISFLFTLLVLFLAPLSPFIFSTRKRPRRRQGVESLCPRVSSYVINYITMSPWPQQWFGREIMLGTSGVGSKAKVAACFVAMRVRSMHGHLWSSGYDVSLTR